MPSAPSSTQSSTASCPSATSSFPASLVAGRDAVAREYAVLSSTAYACGALHGHGASSCLCRTTPRSVLLRPFLCRCLFFPRLFSSLFSFGFPLGSHCYSLRINLLLFSSYQLPGQERRHFANRDLTRRGFFKLALAGSGREGWEGEWERGMSRKVTGR